MEQLSWKRAMSVENSLIDNEHKMLLGMVADIEHNMSTKNVATLLQKFKTFESSVRKHFQHEEEIALAILHPFELHHQEHEYVLNELQLMMNELIGMNGRWSESASAHYLYFLSTWAISHIHEDDMLMKPRLQALPYDFQPVSLETQ